MESLTDAMRVYKRWVEKERGSVQRRHARMIEYNVMKGKIDSNSIASYALTQSAERSGNDISH